MGITSCPQIIACVLKSDKREGELHFPGFSRRIGGIHLTSIIHDELFRRLEYSRAKIAAATKKWLLRCSFLHRLGHNEVDVVRLVRLEGKECRLLD